MQVRGNTWRPSSCRLKNEVMSNIPMVPKVAYTLAKVTNNLLAYDKQQLPYRVKTFDLKKALMYELDSYLSEHELILGDYYQLIANGKISEEEDLGEKWEPEKVKKCIKDEQFLKKVCVWTHRICNQGMRRLLSEGNAELYYFGLGRTRMRVEAVDRLMKYVNVVLGKAVESEQWQECIYSRRAKQNISSDKAEVDR